MDIFFLSERGIIIFIIISYFAEPDVHRLPGPQNVRSERLQS